MGLTGRLRQAVLGGAGEDQLHGAAEVYAVPDGDVDRRDALTRPEHLADDLAPVGEVGGAPLLLAGLLVLANEPTLRTPDCGYVEKET